MFKEAIKSLENTMKISENIITPVKIVLDFSYEIPEYNPTDYAIIAKQKINRVVLVPASKKDVEGHYFIDTINEIPRSIQQKIAIGNASSWSNMVRIYNFFSDEFGYKKITKIQGL